MKREITPEESGRGLAYSMWMQSPMPMVTVTKTFDVTHLVRTSKKRGIKLNTLMCWCIGKAASGINEFYNLIVDGKLYHYDGLGIQVIVKDKNGAMTFCDIPFSDDIKQFSIEYDRTIRKGIEESLHQFRPDIMIIGTSALVTMEFDSVVNQYTAGFVNPFLSWGRYRSHWFHKTLPISMQFHHVLMDGEHVFTFFSRLQQEMNNV
ncbi:MAG: CatA-like O-acetyltransferase, family 2 [Prevotellaceae bacterium]|nr:CatA-like O-acetyltransferase, family 2 [Prevotellaceae bacterium]